MTQFRFKKTLSPADSAALDAAERRGRPFDLIGKVLSLVGSSVFLIGVVGRLIHQTIVPADVLAEVAFGGTFAALLGWTLMFVSVQRRNGYLFKNNRDLYNNQEVL